MRLSIFMALLALAAVGCRPGVQGGARAAAGAPDLKVVNAATAVVIEKPISRFVAATGTLTAEEQADVSAEVAGRVVATPVERGTAVREGTELIRIADLEVRAQVQEAEANAAQIQARLGLGANASFQIDRVPEVANAKASDDLAQADFARARMLNEKQLLSQADFDRSRTQAEAARESAA